MPTIMLFWTQLEGEIMQFLDGSSIS